MILSFNTLTTLLGGCVLLIVYIIVLALQRRVHEINLSEIGSVFFSSSSIISGLKLIYSTIDLLSANIVESDKLYTIYGGFCVIWISFTGYRTKLKLIPKKVKTKTIYIGALLLSSGPLLAELWKSVYN